MQTRSAVANDADAMSAILTAIIKSWQSDRPFHPSYIQHHYIEHQNNIRCSVAYDEAGKIWGFQSLWIARPGNPFGLATGWGIIGTYVDLNAPRQGIGRQLFTSSQDAAQIAGISQIDATIGAKNQTALAYYSAMGFETYKVTEKAISKRYNVSG